MLENNLNQQTVPICIATDVESAQDRKPATEKQPTLAVHPLLRDLVLTMATELSILIAGLALVSLFGRLLGPVALGEFLLVRRITSWLINGALLGMGNAIPRYVAYSVKKPEADRRGYFVAGLICLLTCAAGVEIVFCFWRRSLAHWLFGSTQFTYLILPLGLLFAGLAAQTAIYGYYRGVLEMKRANAIQLFHFAIIPLGAVALLYRTQSVALILDVTGALTLVAAAIFAWPICRDIAHERLGRIKPHAMELLRYGIGRVPGTFGSDALLSLGPLIATHYVSMAKVGYLLLGASFLMVMGYTTGPVGVLLLSKLSAMVGQNRMAEARSSLMHLVGAILDVSVFAAFQLVVFADVLIRAWVGTRFLEALTVTRLLILAIPPFLFYMTLRSCIDAASIKPWNTGNVLISLAIFGVLITGTIKLMPVNFLLDGFAGSLVVALLVLGFLTARTFRRLYSLTFPWREYIPPVMAGIFLGLLSYGMRRLLGFHDSYFLPAIFELLIVASFLGILVKLNSPWLRFLWHMSFSGSKLAGAFSEDSAI